MMSADMSLISQIAKLVRHDRPSRETGALTPQIAHATDNNHHSVDARTLVGFLWWLDSLRLDFILASRRLRQRKITSAAAILSLGLAIGACLAAFQLVDALLLRPLPIAAPDRLYALSRQEFGPNGQFTTRDSWEYPLFPEMRTAVATQANVLAISDAERVEITFGSEAEMERAHLQYVSGDMFASFGLQAAAGRLLSPGDDLQPGAHPVAVISHDYWSRRFAQNSQVIGRTFRITNNLTGTRLYQIVGVAPADFTGTEPGKVVDIFLPAMMHWGMAYPEWSLFRTLVHLHPGISVSPVRNQLSVIFHAFNDSKAGRKKQALEMDAAPAGVSAMQRNYRTSLAAIGVLVVLVLLIACANVANLMAAITAARAREMALRLSIGAGRWRLGRMVLVEAAIIGLFACVAGWFFARWSAPQVLTRVNPPDNPARLSLAMDWRVLACAIVLTLCVSLLFGAAPALRASAIRPVEALKGGDDSPSRARWMRALIYLQAAFCFVVLFAAGLFVATFDRLHGQPNGISSDGLVNIDIVNPINEPSTLWDQVAGHLRRMPGIQAVAYADWPLLDGYGFKLNAISVNNEHPSEVPAWFMNVSPGWFDTMKIPFIAGRDFRPTDLSPGVAIVNQAFARQFFVRENPLGKWFQGTSGWMRGQQFQIVGLVHDARYRYLRQTVLPVAYTPFRRTDAKGTMQGGTLVVRTSTTNPLALASVLRKEIPRTRPEFRVSNLRTQQELIDAQTTRERLLAMLARFFGVVALLLAGVGLYGVLDHSVVQRRREIGIRMALGAQPGDLAVSVTASVFSMVLLGAITGLALSLALVHFIEPLLYQVQSTEFSVLIIPSLAILGAAVLAAMPAIIHAVGIDPASLLRAE
jgi:predicted permease